ncbi:MFS transporter [Streptomyces platensis]|uniref:MDR family MFS transporter n=1 Tax=Streptomyces platensis TaxID=58346 RepID=UPI002E80A47E|nr:MFS transporter [Streptomyces platensis]WUB77744.1 MFS transporter [Streptomyces platensis]WUB84577.1 MFS transporter [Streptomyces platensis]
MSNKGLLTARKAVAESFSGLPAAFWWLWVATLINRLAGFVATFLALYLTQDMGYSASYAGLVVSLYGGGAAVASLVGGALTDIIGRRPTILVAQVLTGVSIVALGMSEQPVLIASLAFVVGVVSHASRPAIGAVIADLVPGQDRSKAYSLNFWAANIGFGVSAAAAGLLARQSYFLLFVCEAVATLLCAVLVFLKVPETRAQPSVGKAADSGSRAGFGMVLKDGPFMCLAGLAFLVVMLFQQAATTLPITMGQEGNSSADYGLVLSFNGLLIVILQIPLSRAMKDRKPLQVLTVASLLCGYGFGLTAFADSLALYAATVAVWTLGEIIFTPIGTQLVADLSPEHARGRYQGVYNLAWASAALATPVMSGFVIDHLGADAIWAACAVIGTAAACGYALLTRTVGARLSSARTTEADVAEGAEPAHATTSQHEGTEE